MNITISKLSDAKLIANYFNSAMRSSITDENIAEAFAFLLSELESPSGQVAELSAEIDELEQNIKELTRAIETNCEALTAAADELKESVARQWLPVGIRAAAREKWWDGIRTNTEKAISGIHYYVDSLYSNIY